MNEKIEELAEQFRMDFSIDENSQDGIHWDNVDEFAELIIRECADICNTSRIKYQSLRKSAMNYEEKEIYNEGIAVSDHIKYKILREFGIE